MRAQVATCSVVAARVAPSRPVRECALTLTERNQIGSLDKSHIVQHKTGREEGNGRPRHGEPRETPCRPFYVAQCVLILRALRAQAAPSRPRLPPLRRLEKLGAGETRRVSRVLMRHFPRAMSRVVPGKDGF
jgi:hypothetical protein